MSRGSVDRVADLAAEVRAGDRRALARAITLIESTRTDDRARAASLLSELLPATGGSRRLGVSGVPGVGKSTFIEAFGLYAIERGHRVAVLAIDPSSKLGGGSILGDKTRMDELSRHAAAFIRPSPTGGTLGGVARRTREAMLACEAAGYDVVIVETVGVGQSETAVAELVDMFLLLLLPAGGDELQGIKKGIVELADLIIVNKADGDLEAAAGRTAAEYQHALHLLRPASPNWSPPMLLCSALTGSGIDKVWEVVDDHAARLGASGEIAQRRAEQAKGWMWDEVSESLLAALREQKGATAKIADLERQVAAGERTPASAAAELLAGFDGTRG